MQADDILEKSMWQKALDYVHVRVNTSTGIFHPDDFDSALAVFKKLKSTDNLPQSKEVLVYLMNKIYILNK